MSRASASRWSAGDGGGRGALRALSEARGLLGRGEGAFACAGMSGAGGEAARAVGSKRAMTKAEAMAACDSLHQRLLKCYDAGGDWCRAESKEFWDCYREAKGEGSIRFDFARLFDGFSSGKRE